MDYAAVIKAAIKYAVSEGSLEFANSHSKGSINKTIENAMFATFLQGIMRDSNPGEINHFAEVIDIDGDGCISKEDLETFVRRTLQLSDSHQRSLTEPRALNVYAIEPLDEKDFNRAIFEIRKVMDRKRMGNLEFFKKLDANDDGFLSIEEFCANIDKVVVFPQKVKEALFAAMDKLKIGMIDYKTFLKTMQKSLIVPEAVNIKFLIPNS